MDHPFLLKSLIYLRYVKVSWLEMRHVPPKAVACVLHLYLGVPVILMLTCNKELNLMIIVSHYPAHFPLLQGSVLLKLVTLVMKLALLDSSLLPVVWSTAAASFAIDSSHEVSQEVMANHSQFQLLFKSASIS